MSAMPLESGAILPEKGPGGVPASQVRGILRTFQRALASEGLVDIRDTVTISQEARTLAAEIAQAQGGPDGKTPSSPL
jgi:hypothetical protein